MANSVIGLSAITYATDNSALMFDETYNNGFVAQNATTAGIYKNSGLLLFRGSGGNTVGAAATQNNYMAINLTSGNVGIGTTTPSSALHLYGANGVYPSLEISGSAGATNAIIASYLSGGVYGLQLQTGGATPYVFFSNPNTGVSIGSSYATTNPPASGLLVQGNVGIGTTSPQYPLDVTVPTNGAININASGGQATVYLGQAGTQNGGLNAEGGGGTDIELISKRNIWIGNQSNGPSGFSNGWIYFDTGETTRAAIDSSGHMGIGTTTMANPLDVYGSAAFGTYAGTATGASNELIVGGNVGIGTTGPGAKLDVTSADNGTEDISQIYALNQTQGIGEYYNGIHEIGSNANNALHIDSLGTGYLLLQANGGTGNVGIGTTVPTQALDVNGNIDAMGSSNGYLTEIANAGTTGTTANKLAKLTGAPATAVITATTDTDGVVGIVTGGAGTTGNAQITIDGQASCVFDNTTVADDFVTISSTTGGDCHDAGTTRSTTSQTIGRVLASGSAGTYTVALGLNASASASGAPIGSGTTNYVARWTPNGNTLGIGTLYDNGTDVGIGTTAPQALFHVATSSADSLQWSAILQNPDNVADANVGVGLQFKTSSYINGHESAKWAGLAAVDDIGTTYGDYLGLAFYTNNAETNIERVRITSAGSVGIGTTNPGATFTVGNNVFEVTSGGAFTATQGTVNGAFYQGSGYADIGNYNSGGTYPTIGNTLQIASNFSSGNAEVNIWNTINPATYTSTGIRFMQELTGSTYRDLMFLSNTGNVGIGTASPASILNGTASRILDITGASPGPIITLHDSSDPLKEVSIYNVSSGAYFDSTGAATASNNQIVFRTNNTNSSNSTGLITAMTIASSGNVGIGTTSPATGMKVDIRGPIKVAGTGSEACTAATAGAMRYNSAGNYMEICTYP